MSGVARCGGALPAAPGGVGGLAALAEVGDGGAEGFQSDAVVCGGGGQRCGEFLAVQVVEGEQAVEVAVVAVAGVEVAE